jgi:signal transduction histidine kinase
VKENANSKVVLNISFAVPVLIGLLLRFPLDTFSLVAGRTLVRWLLLVYQFLVRIIPLLQSARLTQALSANNAQLLEANGELQATNAQLTALDKLKYQFLSIASHELHTPITVILGNIELLSVSGDKLSPEQRKEFSKKTLEAGNRLSQQPDVIYEVNRLDFDLQHLQTCPILLKTVIAEVADILAAERVHQQRLLRVDVPEEVIVLASTRHVCELLLHLLSNAFKYSPEGTPITITVSLQEDMVTVAIQDQGLGIPPEAHPLLFERFVRLERVLNSLRRGAGLGLASCKQIVESMGGHIWIESSGIPGEGSTAFFTLRRAPTIPPGMNTKQTKHPCP